MTAREYFRHYFLPRLPMFVLGILCLAAIFFVLVMVPVD